MLIDDEGPAFAESPSILTKAFQILSAFNSRDRVMTLRDLAEAAGLPKSTVHRLLVRLTELGAVERHGDGYKLGLSLLQLGSTTPAAALRDAALPSLAALQRRTHRTVHFGVLRGFEVVYLEKMAVPGCRSVLSGVGTHLPANCTAVGKSLLAALDEATVRSIAPPRLCTLTQRSITDLDRLCADLDAVRRTGLALEHEEARPGLACVAVTVTVRGEATAAVSLSYAVEDGVPAHAIDALRATAVRIGRDVRGACSLRAETETSPDRTVSAAAGSGAAGPAR